MHEQSLPPQVKPSDSTLSSHGSVSNPPSLGNKDNMLSPVEERDPGNPQWRESFYLDDSKWLSVCPREWMTSSTNSLIVITNV
jgi:hypothetical protein